MKLRRRRVLQGLGVGLVGLAGCSEASTDGTGATPTESPDSDSADQGLTTETGTPAEDETATVPDRARWHVETAVSPRRLVLVDGTVYVGTSGLDSDRRESEVLAVESDGSVRWRRETGQRNGTIAGVTDGTVYAISGDLDQIGLHGRGYRLHAFDVTDGSRFWTWAPKLSHKFFTAVGIGETSVFVGTHDDALSGSGEELYAIDRGDGSIRWHVETGDVMSGVLVGDTVLANDSRAVEAFGTADGDSRWTFEYEDYGGTSPTAFGDLVLAGERTLHALNAADGTERWTYGNDSVVTSWQSVGDTTYVGGDRIAALDHSGREQWTDDRGGHVQSAVTAADTLFAASRHALFALDRADGTEYWRIQTDAEHPHPAALADGRLAYETGDGRLVVVDAETGDTAWEWQPAKGVSETVVVDGTFVVGRDGGDVFGLPP